MLVILAPGGGLASYIGINLLKIKYKPSLQYHDQFYGFRISEKKMVFQTYGVDNFILQDKLCMQVHQWTEEFNKFFSVPNIEIVQIIIDKFPELVLLNWLYKRPKEDIIEWKNSQKKCWESKSKNYIEMASCHWLLKMHDKNFIDIRKIPKIKKTFNFSSVYEEYSKSKKEFQNFEIEYSEQQHTSFLLSQEAILKKWRKIHLVYKDNPMSVEDPFERGIAIGMHATHLSISEQEVFKKFNL